MATSSIFANVRITDPKMAEEIIIAMDAAANSYENSVKERVHTLVTDPDKIRAIIAERGQKYNHV